MNTTDNYTIDPNDLTDDDRELWHERVWTTLDLGDYHILRTPRRTSGAGMPTLHIPQACLDDDDPHECHTSVRSDAAACRSWERGRELRVKPPSAFPPGYTDLCAYCLYEFSQWWEYDRDR